MKPVDLKSIDTYIPTVIKDKDLFYSIEKRIPRIFVEVADHFINTYDKYLQVKYADKPLTDEQLKEANDEAKDIYEKTIEYSKEPTVNCPFKPINDDYLDAYIWNERLKKLNEDKVATYLNTPFLFTECYMYRRLMVPFFKSKYFKDYDVFIQIKQDGIIKSRQFAINIIEYVANVQSRINDKKSTDEQEFETFLHLALWGNHFDLSGINIETVMANYKLIDEKKKSKIISDSTKEIYEYFKSSPDNNHMITFILDNAGYELLGDLCFIETLYQTDLLNENSKIIFHCKPYSWFVSDVVLDHDFTWLLKYLENEFESDVVKRIAKRWSNFLQNKNWELRTHAFWNTPFKFSEMGDEALDLYNELTKSDVVFICGDLNYRKLINDLLWNPYTTFEEAILEFKPTNLVSIRTVKSRPIVNLKNDFKLPEIDWSFKDWTKKVYW